MSVLSDPDDGHGRNRSIMTASAAAAPIDIISSLARVGRTQQPIGHATFFRRRHLLATLLPYIALWKAKATDRPADIPFPRWREDAACARNRHRCHDQLAPKSLFQRAWKAEIVSGVTLSRFNWRILPVSPTAPLMFGSTELALRPRAS
jgi:hypothetical protein